MLYKYKIIETYIYEGEIEANTKEEALKKMEEVHGDEPPENWIYGEDSRDWEDVFVADAFTYDSATIEINE